MVSSGFADDANWTVINEEIGSRRARWEIMEVEEESSSMAITVQMEVAEAMETLRMD